MASLTRWTWVWANSGSWWWKPGMLQSMGFQARILEWVIMPSSRGSTWPRYQTHVSYVSFISRWVLYHWGTFKAHMINVDSVLKSRDITLLTKVCLVKAMVFPEVMYGCESWTIKKAECQRIDVFELWCCRRLLIVPWTAGRSNQSILREINPEYSLEGLMLKLKLQNFGYLMWRTDSFEKP